MNRTHTTKTNQLIAAVGVVAAHALMFIASSCLAVYFGDRKRYSLAFVGGM